MVENELEISNSSNCWGGGKGSGKNRAPANTAMRKVRMGKNKEVWPARILILSPGPEV